MTASAHDSVLMRVALGLARRSLGHCWPNPAVGALIVDESGRIVGRGWTAKGGRPHAEPQALAAAGDKARGATMYVTLEPCPHTGKTPPCADAIRNAGIARVVVGCADPDERVSGKGIAQLKSWGIAVTENVCEAEARALNAGFFKRVQNGTPQVSLKIATSLDGRMATRTGQNQWLTSEPTRNQAHLLRASHDAILTGIDTVLADDPMLTCRLPGMEPASPVRVVLDSNLRIPMGGKLVTTAHQTPTWVLTLEPVFSAEAEKVAALERAGVRVLSCADRNGRVNLPAMLKLLGDEGITRLLVEAGPRVTTALLDQRLVDRLYWFRANLVIGEGRDAFGHCMPAVLAEIPRMNLVDHRRFGNDTLEVFACSPA